MNLFNIKVGDRVWIGYGRNHRNRLETVQRVSPTMFTVSHSWRYYKVDGARVGGAGWANSYVSGIATPEECAVWDAAQAKASEDTERRRKAEAQAEAKRRELCGLFTNKDHVSRHDDGLYSVSIGGLTEDEVRELAAKMPHPKGK